MKLIIPMAGMGKRMRPHTLTIPKPLIQVAGKPIVQWLVEDIAAMCEEKIQEVAFVVGDFGKDVEKRLLAIADEEGMKGSIVYQNQPLGTAHAILCASHLLNGNVIIAFADTLFRADIKIDTNENGIIWVHKVADPSQFGVVTTDKDGYINGFEEKPENPVSDLAIIGIYFFRDGENLKNEMQFLIDNNIKEKGEYQLTTALENMRAKGSRFTTAKVTEWLDCGNKDATVYTNQRLLEFNKNKPLRGEKVDIDQSVIIEPCFIGQDVQIRNSVIGPHVSIGAGSTINSCVIENTIIQAQTDVENKTIANSMIGNHVIIKGKKSNLSIGDHTQQQE